MIRYPLYVTIDTNIFDAAGYDLDEKSTLNHLCSYVQSGKIKIVLSNIVIREIQGHVQEKAKDVATQSNNLRRYLKKNHYPDDFVTKIGMGHLLPKVDGNALAVTAKENLNSFIKKLHAEIMDSSMVDVEKIFDDYFNIEAPFEHNEKKRKEFPDAFIAAQIKARFENEEVVAIVSSDKGLKKACSNSKMIFFDSLGDLYNFLSKKEEENYTEAVNSINSSNEIMCSEIKRIIADNDCVIVAGLSHDRDGIVEGYDYDETYVNNVSEVKVKIHTIDEIQNNKVFATLLCTASIQVSCFFNDYENAAWDSETRSYIYLEKRKMVETHKANFAIKIQINTETNEYSLSAFTVSLGGDTRIERIEITDEYEYDDYDYEQEIRDMDRESVGLTPLGSYENYLEEKLIDSKMKQDIICIFEELEGIYRKFEDVVMNYEELIDLLQKDPKCASTILAKIIESEPCFEDFPLVSDVDITNEEIEEVILWLEKSCAELEPFFNEKSLPDTINYGDSISILNREGEKVLLSFDEVNIHPLEGSEEYIYISLSCDSWDKTYKGYVKLTVGYINFDEDGGVEDGREDDIEYDYSEIVEKMEDISSGLQDLLDPYYAISEIIDLV